MNKALRGLGNTTPHASLCWAFVGIHRLANNERWWGTQPRKFWKLFGMAIGALLKKMAARRLK
jgi:hypothetical protein